MSISSLPDHISPFLDLSECLAVLDFAKWSGVRVKSDFIDQYKRANGRLDQLSDYWICKREEFITRTMSQIRANNEALYKVDGTPTKRHLALIMWAYSPDWENK